MISYVDNNTIYIYKHTKMSCVLRRSIARPCMHHPSVLEVEGFVQKQRIPVHICARFFIAFLRERTHTYLILILLFFCVQGYDRCPLSLSR